MPSVEATVEHLQCSYAPHWRLCQTDAPADEPRRRGQWQHGGACYRSVRSHPADPSHSRRPCWLQVARGRGHWRCAHCGSLTVSSTRRPRTRPFKLTARPRGPSRGSSSLRLGGHGRWPVRSVQPASHYSSSKPHGARTVRAVPPACAADADPR